MAEPVSYESKFAEARLNDGQRLFKHSITICLSEPLRIYPPVTGFLMGMKWKNIHQRNHYIDPGRFDRLAEFCFNMAYGVAGLFEKNLTLKHPKLKEEQLLFVVREPFRACGRRPGYR